MKIKTSWTYSFEWVMKDNNIIIWDWLQVVIFELVNSRDILREIIVWNNSKLIYRFLWYGECNFDVKIDFMKNWANWDISYMFLSSWDDIIRWSIDNHIRWENIDVNVCVVWLVWDWWKVSVDWNINVGKWSKEINWHLNEQTVFIWNSWESNLLPKLEINSNDVKASHWVRIDRLDDNKLFYMMSKWVNFEESKKLMISSYINNFFWLIWEKKYLKEKLFDYLMIR